MLDLTKQESTLSSAFTRYQKIFNFLGIEGLFILGLGLGWILASFSQGEAFSTIALFLSGLGGLFVLAFLLYYLGAKRARLAGHNKTLSQAVDIRDSVRAFRLHGSQVPLWETRSNRSEVVVLDAKQGLLLPQTHNVILEHWSGPMIKLHLKNRDLKLAPQQLLQLREFELEEYNSQKYRLTIEPAELFTDEDVILLVHLISKDTPA
jgi:hypothetical protein